MLYLVPIIPLTLVVAFILRRRFGGSAYGIHRLSLTIAGLQGRVLQTPRKGSPAPW